MAGLVVGLALTAVVRARDTRGVSGRMFGPTVIGAGRNLVYEVPEPMPELSGKATVYRLANSPPADRVAKLQAAFRAAFTNGAGVFVTDEPGARWVFTSPYQLPLVPGVEMAAPVYGGDLTKIEQEPLPSQDAARHFVSDLLARAGLDVKGADFTFHPGKTALLVEVAPRLDGRPTTSMSSFVAVDAQLIALQASGWLAPPKSVGEAPLVGVEEVLRASAQRSGPATSVKAPLIVRSVELVHEKRDERVVPSYRIRCENGPDLTLIAINQ